jgi:hypothetical protein
MDLIVAGWAASVFQAWQQCSIRGRGDLAALSNQFAIEDLHGTDR